MYPYKLTKREHAALFIVCFRLPKTGMFKLQCIRNLQTRPAHLSICLQQLRGLCPVILKLPIVRKLSTCSLTASQDECGDTQPARTTREVSCTPAKWQIRFLFSVCANYSVSNSAKAYLSVIGGFCALLCTVGFVVAFGVFQGYYTDHLLQGKSEFDVSWIGSTTIFLLYVSAPICGALVDRFGPKVSIICLTILNRSS
jgi:hypothetical protein